MNFNLKPIIDELSPYLENGLSLEAALAAYLGLPEEECHEKLRQVQAASEPAREYTHKALEQFQPGSNCFTALQRSLRKLATSHRDALHTATHFSTACILRQLAEKQALSSDQLHEFASQSLEELAYEIGEDAILLVWKACEYATENNFNWGFAEQMDFSAPGKMELLRAAMLAAAIQNGEADGNLQMLAKNPELLGMLTGNLEAVIPIIQEQLAQFLSPEEAQNELMQQAASERLICLIAIAFTALIVYVFISAQTVLLTMLLSGGIHVLGLWLFASLLSLLLGYVGVKIAIGSIQKYCAMASGKFTELPQWTFEALEKAGLDVPAAMTVASIINKDKTDLVPLKDKAREGSPENKSAKVPQELEPND